MISLVVFLVLQNCLRLVTLLIAAVYLNVAVAVLVEIEARNAALGIEMLLVAVSRSSMGSAKAAVLPVPVWAQPIRSRPDSTGGIAAA